jgi:hypothetical protein
MKLFVLFVPTAAIYGEERISIALSGIQLEL